MLESQLRPVIALKHFKTSDSDIHPADLSIELLSHFRTRNILLQDNVVLKFYFFDENIRPNHACR